MGSVKINRFSNLVLKYGTAKTAVNGDRVNNNGKVTFKVENDKEIVEELAIKDIKLHLVSSNRSTDVTSGKEL